MEAALYTKQNLLIDFEKLASELFYQKYKFDPLLFDYKILNELIFNEKSKIVAKFKDYLIHDDQSEFLRRYYNRGESKHRLQKFTSFYEMYSKIFPNYVSIPESKYLYKNIRRKQKLIDAYNQMKKEEEEHEKIINIDQNTNNKIKKQLKIKKKDSNEFFDSMIKKSILRYQPSYLNFENSLDDHTKLGDENTIMINKFNFNDESKLSIQSILGVLDNKKENDKTSYQGAYKSKMKSVITESLKSNLSKLSNKPVLVKKSILENFKSKKKELNGYSNSNKVQRLQSPETSKNTTGLTNEIKTNPKYGMHRVSSSIPELYKSVKIINNYPNIIIPNSSTQVNINQNYFNYNYNTPSGTKVIIIEKFDENLINIDVNQTSDPPEVKTKVVNPNNKYPPPLETIDLNQYNILNTINTVVATPTYKKTKTLSNDFLLKTTVNINDKNKSSYMNILSKSKKDKPILNNRIISPKSNDFSSSSKIINVFKKNETSTDKSKDYLEVKSRLQMKQAYKDYLEKNKLECFTARNSQEKVDKIASNYIKTLNLDTLNRVYLTTNQSLSNGQGQNNILLPTSPKTLERGLTHLTKTQSLVKNKSKTRDHTVLKNLYNSKKDLVSRKPKVLNFPIKECVNLSHKSIINPSQKKIENLKGTFSNPFEKQVKEAYKTSNKPNVKNGIVRSYDFQSLKQFK